MAFSLNSSNALLGVAPSVLGYPFSLMGWFRVPNVTTQISLMGIVNISGGSRCEVLFAGDTTKTVVAKASAGNIGIASSASAMTPGDWHHLVAVFASNTSRTIYLDGGNANSNTDMVEATSLEYIYIGSLTDSTIVDLAEVSVVGAAVSAEQAASLAKGCPLMSTSLAGQVVAYQDCIRQLNSPGVDVVFTSVGTPDVIEHPRIFSSTGGRLGTMPLRFRGPWLAEQTELHPLVAEIGQHATSGTVLKNSIISGEVMS